MNTDLQRAGLTKRFAAYTFDLIILACLVVAIAWGVSALLGYSDYSDQMDAIYDQYSQEYGVTLPVESATYDELLELEEGNCTAEQWAEREAYLAALEALEEDQEAIRLNALMINMSLLIISVSILGGYALLEFLVPLLFGNGQTMGKKAFSIAVTRLDGVKITPFMLFVRTFLGKAVVETMIPALTVAMLFMGNMSILLAGILLTGLILLLQVILLVVTRNHCAIHDMFACTVVVDMATQRIFASADERTEYLRKVSAENAARGRY